MGWLSFHGLSSHSHHFLSPTPPISQAHAFIISSSCFSSSSSSSSSSSLSLKLPPFPLFSLRLHNQASMASFSSCTADIDWLWGSLKPWQILHSTLAERERNGSALDVWELVNETLGAANYTANSITREEVEQKGPYSSWAHGMRFLGDDGEFWKPGGVMESRVREWLSRRDEEQELTIHTAAAVTSPPPSAHNFQQHYNEPSNTSSELAIAACHSSTLPRLLERFHDRPSSSELQFTVADQRGYDADTDYQSSECSEVEEDEIAAEIGDVDDQAAELAAAEENQDHYRVCYALVSSNYEDDDHYNGISSVGESRLVVNRYCSAAAGADRDPHQCCNGAAKSAAGPQLHLEEEKVEEVEVCAVCLEKLNDDDNEESEDAAVQALACRHLFHRACIAPWLERQPHACCPCCRSPILAPPQALHSAALLHLSVPPPSNCSGHHHQHAAAPPHDIMGLLADMEAALERLGFRS